MTFPALATMLARVVAAQPGHCTGRRPETFSRERPPWVRGLLEARRADGAGGAGEFQQRWAPFEAAWQKSRVEGGSR